MNDMQLAAAPFRDPPRPPTPPKEHFSDPCSDIKPDRVVSTRSSLYTPEESPSSSAELGEAFSIAARKRVKISGNTSYHHIAGSHGTGYDSDELRKLPRSRDCKSTKSILKPRQGHPDHGPGNERPLLDDASIESMLKSANGHLRSGSRSSSLDAYSNLSACLSTYDTLDTTLHEVDAHVREIAQYLKRDISIRVPVDGSVEPQLIAPALRIVILFLASSDFSNSLPDEFKIFLIDRAISSLDSAETPKIILAQYMHILEKQKFGPKLMTVDRIQRLLVSLEKLENHARSPRIAAHRLMIYRRLLQQAKPIMVARVSTWLPHLFNGLLSSVKDIRLRAISLGLEAGMQVGSTNTVTRACLELLERKNRQDESVMKRLHDRSLKMVNALEDPDQVPQIWSILILLMRNHRSKIETWNHFSLWKEIVIRCLSSSHIQTLHQAHLAINRLIFVVDVDSMSTAMARFIKDVTIGQLNRKPSHTISEKKLAISKHLARSTYCILLYTCLHPNASHAHLDSCWDLYVDDILASCLTGGTSDTLFACEVLSALLSYQGPPRVWNERQAITIGPILPKELLNIDPRWVRSRAEKITKTLQKLSGPDAWFANEARVIPFFRTWQHFIMAIGSASSKEVRVSNDTIVAMSSVMNQLNLVTEMCSNRQLDYDKALEILSFFLDEMIANIGMLALNEKRLAGTTTGSFQAILDNPSSRVKTQSKSADSVPSHMMELLLGLDCGAQEVKVRALIGKLVSVLLHSTQSRSARLAALSGLSQRFLRPLVSRTSQISEALSHIITEMTSKIIDCAHSGEVIPVPSYSSQELSDTVKILELATMYLTPESLAPWQICIKQVAHHSSLEFGSAGHPWPLEPVCHALCGRSCEEGVQLTLNAAVTLLEHVSWPQRTTIAENARARPWHSTIEKRKLPTAGLPDTAFTLAKLSLNQAFNGKSSLSTNIVQSLLSATASVLASCPTQWKTLALGRLQAELAAWIQDPETTLHSQAADSVSQEVERIWVVVAAIISGEGTGDNDLLAQTHIVLTAGLRSRRTKIANGAVSVWNKIFGGVDDLEYASDLASALQATGSLTPVHAVGLPMDPGSDNYREFPFVESQGLEIPASFEPGPRVDLSKLLTISGSGRPANVHSKQASTKSFRDSETISRPRRTSKPTPKAKLRHDDSQIEFAPIDSSPLASDRISPILLTERQEEVRVRQHGQAGLFPQLQSSIMDAASSVAPQLPTFNMKSRGRRVSISKIAEGSSPILPPLDVSDGALGSSPTPSSSRHRSEERSLDDEIPSSPPDISMQLSGSLLNSREHGPDIGPSSSRPESADIGKSRKAKDEPLVIDVDPHSDQEVFVDAPSEPLALVDQVIEFTVPVVDHSIKDLSSGSQIFTVDEPARKLQTEVQDISLADVSRSLFAESVMTPSLQRMSQDTEEHAQQSDGQDAEAGSQSNKRKRKINGDDTQTRSTRVGKRRAISPAEEKTKRANVAAREIAADCVLIDSRPLEGVFQSVSPEKEPVVKQEREESPVLGDLPIIPRASSVPGHRTSRRSKTSTTRKTASQGQVSERRTARQARINKEPKEEKWDSDRSRGNETRQSSHAGKSSAPSAAMAPTLAIAHAIDITDGLEGSGAGSKAMSDEVADLISTPPGQSPGQGLIQELRSLHDRLQGVSLQHGERDEFLETLFKLGLEAQAASRRGLAV